MKNSLCCPKCGNKKIWEIEEVRHKGKYAGGEVLSVVFEKSIGPAKTGFFGDGTRSEVTAGHYDVYICANCGYTEWFAQDFEALEENENVGVRLLEGD